MKVWFLMNDKGEFICKNHSGKLFPDKEKIHQALNYKYKANAEEACSKQYYRYNKHKIKISEFYPVYVEISIKPALVDKN